MQKLLKLLIILILILLPVNSLSLDRCDDFIPDVRAQHIRYFGPRASWWYGIGQLRQESNCRAKATAWDQGMGIAQFMPATAKEINRLMKTNLDPYNPEHAIRMQAYYMSSLHRQNWDEQKRLWLTYQAYNGGYGNLKSEYRRAGKVDWLAMKENCKRRKVTLKSGQVLDFCEVNYDYSVKVHKYGKVYRSQNIDQIKFW